MHVRSTTQLRGSDLTTPTQQEAEMEGRIRALLDRAASTLNRVDYRNLGANARTQYDTAKGFRSDHPHSAGGRDGRADSRASRPRGKHAEPGGLPQPRRQCTYAVRHR